MLDSTYQFSWLNNLLRPDFRPIEILQLELDACIGLLAMQTSPARASKYRKQIKHNEVIHEEGGFEFCNLARSTSPAPTLQQLPLKEKVGMQMPCDSILAPLSGPWNQRM